MPKSEIITNVSSVWNAPSPYEYFVKNQKISTASVLFVGAPSGVIYNSQRGARKKLAGLFQSIHLAAYF